MVKVAMAEEGEVRNEEKQAKGGEEYRRTGGAASHGTSGSEGPSGLEQAFCDSAVAEL